MASDDDFFQVLPGREAKRTHRPLLGKPPGYEIGTGQLIPLAESRESVGGTKLMRSSVLAVGAVAVSAVLMGCEDPYASTPPPKAKPPTRAP